MNAIVESYRTLRESQPRLRARDAARTLGISEAELVAAGCFGEVRRLVPDFRSLLQALPELGEVTVICRNEAAVHEKKGPFTPPEFGPAGAITHGGPIDLRLFLSPWRHAFAQREPGGRRSLQIFDRQGVAILKIFLDADAHDRHRAFNAFVERFADRGDAPLTIEPPQQKPTSGQPIDADRLRARWAALKDTHEFFPMLRELGIERTAALESVGEAFSREIRTEVVEELLRTAADRALPIMVFVGNRGAIQIHTGPVRRIVRTDGWLNVLDPDFNLHLDTRLVRRAFRVRKPTADGVVTSIELFDDAGEAIALFFGARKPGIRELEAWRELVADLEVDHA